MQHESERSLLTLGAAAAISAGTTINGTVIDMAGYDGVRIFVAIATANAGNFLKAQGGEVSDGSDAADLAGSKVIVDSNGDIAILDILKPRERYIRGVIIRGGANTVTGELYYERYNASAQPVNNDVLNEQNFVRLLSPAEGTA